MTYQNDFTLPGELLEQIASEGFDILPELIRILVNAAMQIEREKYLRAGTYERSPERCGYGNGYKPKTVKTRLGEITFNIPQVREGGFYPQALEKGLRSERALNLTLAEMYVQGVSTRKVKAVIEKLCGASVSSTQVSRASGQLDEVLEAWRNDDDLLRLLSHNRERNLNSKDKPKLRLFLSTFIDLYILTIRHVRYGYFDPDTEIELAKVFENMIWLLFQYPYMIDIWRTTDKYGRSCLRDEHSGITLYVIDSIVAEIETEGTKPTG